MNEALAQLDALLAQTATSVPRFPPNSRYHATPIVATVTAGGRTIVHLARRLVPQPDRFATFRLHMVVQGDRLDRLAAGHLGDPELYYRICDANGVIRPDELIETPGRRLRLTMPEGIPGTTDG